MIDIGLVVGDSDGAAELLPVVQALNLELGSKDKLFCKWLVDPIGQAKEWLAAQGVAAGSDKAGELFEELDVVVYGVSASVVDYINNWINWARRHKVSVVGVQGFFGVGNENLATAPPQTLCVVSAEAAKMVRLATEKLTGTPVEVIVTGKPRAGAWNRLMAEEEKTRFKLRSRLEVGSEERLVVYWSGDRPRRVEEQLFYLLTHQLIHESRLVIRWHPKLPVEARPRLENLLNQPSLSLVAADNASADELVLAADLNLAEWSSNQALFSVLADRPTLVWCLPYDLDERVAGGYAEGKPPLVLHGGTPVRNQPELSAKLSLLATDDWRLLRPSSRAPDWRRFREEICDPAASQRVADIIIFKYQN